MSREVEVVGTAPLRRRRSSASSRSPSTRRVADGHVAVAFVDASAIAALNAEHRSKEGPTDVLSFPVDEAGEAHGPRELGDVVICPEHTTDLREAVVHGTLHLVGYDHEADDGEMLALQAEILAR